MQFFYPGQIGLLVFVEGGKLENLDKNPQSKVRANNKIKSHIWHRARIKPTPHWLEAQFNSSKTFKCIYHEMNDKNSKNSFLQEIVQISELFCL